MLIYSVGKARSECVDFTALRDPVLPSPLTRTSPLFFTGKTRKKRASIMFFVRAVFLEFI
jgi:hypothetical protein